jgi:hypothetical protein
METLIVLCAVYFLLMPIVGGALAFLAGAVRTRLAAQPKALSGWHPLNPYYKLSPYHFGKR